MDMAQRRQELLYAVASADAYGEIQNTVGRAAIAFMFHQPEKIREQFLLEENTALAFPGVGECRGAEAVSAAIDELAGEPLKPGEMTDCHLCSPIIHMGADGASARCSWELINAIGEPTPEGPERAKAVWGFGTLRAELACREGQWRITSLRYERRVRCDYDLGWVKGESA